MIIAQLEILKMFTAYAEDMGYMNNGLHKKQYHCKKCGQLFMAAWGKKSGMNSYVENGNFFTCPNCGEMHYLNVAYIPRGVEAPDRVLLTINSFKKIITFTISCKTIKFVGDMDIRTNPYKESFRFDFEKQEVTFIKSQLGAERESYVIGNPFDLKVLEDSILVFFQRWSLGNINHKKEINHILKKLREAVHKKLQEHLGYKVHSMYVSPGQYHGSFLLPIFNIAYRVTCPDAPNLPEVYREQIAEIKGFWKSRLINNFDFMDTVMKQTRKKVEFFQVISKVHKLPEKPAIKKILKEDPFGFNLLKKAFRICKNYDYAISMYQGLKKMNESKINNLDSPSYFKFLEAMKAVYGEKGIVRLVEERTELDTRDCSRLYEQLNEDNKALIKAEKPKISDLHDWMSLKHKQQNHKNQRFDIPEHIIKRLSMQKEKLEFFLPKESKELLVAGHELHNCVASYGERMRNNSLCIVLVADEKGKLTACLEIENNTIVQAKIDRNKQACSDNEVNNAIIAWAKDANLKIKTTDIKIPKENKEKVSVSA